jgi:prophage DNA circulation protein
MAPSLYIPQFNNLRLRLEPPQSGVERGLIQHDVVDADGAALEDTGLRARTFRFTCWFWGDNRERNGVVWDDHAAFVDQLSRRNTVHTFVHPVHGSLQVRVASWNERTRGLNAIGYDVSVVEEPPAQLVSQESPLIVPAIEALYADGQRAQMASVADGVRAELGDGAGSLLDKALDSGTSLATQFAGASRSVRTFVAKVDSFVSTMEGAAALVESAADSVVATIDFGTSLPGRIVGAAASAMDRMATAYQSVTTAPEQFLSSFYSAVDELKGSVDAFSNEITVSAALQATWTTSKLLETDEELRNDLRDLEQQQPVDIMGRAGESAPMPSVMSLQELEYVTTRIREKLDEAVAVNRGNRSLNEMAIQLQRWVNTIKLEREHIRTVTVDTVQPLYAVLLKHNVSYRKAERVLALNPGVKNPSYVSGEVKIYA